MKWFIKILMISLLSFCKTPDTNHRIDSKMNVSVSNVTTDSLAFYLVTDSLIKKYIREIEGDIDVEELYLNIEQRADLSSINAFELYVYSRPNQNSDMPNSFRRITTTKFRIVVAFFYERNHPEGNLIRELLDQEGLLLAKGKLDSTGLNDIVSYTIVDCRGDLEILKYPYRLDKSEIVSSCD